MLGKNLSEFIATLKGTNSNVLITERGLSREGNRYLSVEHFYMVPSDVAYSPYAEWDEDHDSYEICVNADGTIVNFS
jgi:hypothetical protein